MCSPFLCCSLSASLDVHKRDDDAPLATGRCLCLELPKVVRRPLILSAWRGNPLLLVLMMGSVVRITPESVAFGVWFSVCVCPQLALQCNSTQLINFEHNNVIICAHSPRALLVTATWLCKAFTHSSTHYYQPHSSHSKLSPGTLNKRTHNLSLCACTNSSSSRRVHAITTTVAPKARVCFRFRRSNNRT